MFNPISPPTGLPLETRKYVYKILFFSNYFLFKKKKNIKTSGILLFFPLLKITFPTVGGYHPIPSLRYSRKPVDSIREAVFTVSPNRQYLGMVRPTTPATTGPVE